MNKSGRLEIVIGPMFSGKSSELIRYIKQFRVINKKILILKPECDKRYDSNRIVSHDGIKEDCIVVNDLLELDEKQINNHDIIIIDEGQFFKSLKVMVLKWTEMFRKYVIVGGLDGDYQRNPIGEILDLIPYADKYHKFCALCKYCNDGTKAIFSKRISNFGDQILIGSDEYYVPVCRYHFLQN
jgi:thymidine kinase